MACQSKFDKTLDLGCVGEVIAELRSGNAKPLVVAEKILWIVGCGLSFLKPAEGPVAFRHLTDDQLLNELQSAHAIATGPDPSIKAINPEIIALLIQFLIRMLAKIQF